MAEIKVTPSEVRRKAEELRDLNQHFKGKVGNLEAAERNLSSQWEGEANRAFHDAFNRDKGQWDSFYSHIQQYAQALEQIAAEYEKKESMNAQIAGRRSY